MTHPGSDGVIRGAGEVVDPGFADDEEEDLLRGVRHLLDRLYAVEDASDAEAQELIRQILLAGLDARHVGPPTSDGYEG